MSRPPIVKKKGKSLAERFSYVIPGVPIINTDGGCVDNGTTKAKAGIGVYFGKDDPRNISERYKGPNPSNQTAELSAAIKGLEATTGPVNIRTDSGYTIDCMNTWIPAWKKNGWKTASGRPVKNQALIRRLDELCKDRRVNWVWVRGHRGDPGNEGADKLATAGIHKPL